MNVFFSGATLLTGLTSRVSSGGQRSMMRDLSRWIWVSISPAQARPPAASCSRPSAAQQVYRMASSHGFGRKDCASVYQFLAPSGDNAPV